MKREKKGAKKRSNRSVKTHRGEIHLRRGGKPPKSPRI